MLQQLSRRHVASAAALAAVVLMLAAPSATSYGGAPQPNETGVGPIDEWVSVDAGGGYGHTCGIQQDQGLWCWGWNDAGQLGLGDHETRYQPLRVGSDNDWASVSVEASTTCAIRSAGTLWCWGDHYSTVPTQVGSASDWTSISLGWDFRCGVRADTSLWCWGHNGFGQLGLGDAADRSEPTQVGTGWRAAGTGLSHTCGVRTDATLWCWGDNLDGQLGIGQPPYSANVPKRVGSAADWTAVDLGSRSSCGTRSPGVLWCWGNNDFGQLGQGDRLMRTTPAQVGTYRHWLDLSNGGGHVCARRGSALWCWGSNDYGELGTDGPPDSVLTPIEVGDAQWGAIAAGGRDTCGVQDDHTLWCWGAPERGELGVGNRTRHTNVPVQVGLPNRPVPVSYTLSGVNAVASDDVWAVGETQRKAVVSTFVERWDGSSWVRVPAVDPGRRYSSLAAVAGVSSQDLWSVGSYRAYGTEHPLLEHWDGSSWARDSVGDGVTGRLVAVSARASDDVWAVGDTNLDSGADAIAAHWDGSSWTFVPTAPGWSIQRLTDVDVVSATDVWAVGYGKHDEEAGWLPLSEHWDGTQWREVKVPFGDRFDDYYLRAVAAVSEHSVWALGDQPVSLARETTLGKHWNGSKWVAATVPDPGVASGTYLYGADAAGAGDVWTVGRSSDGSRFGAFSSHYDGQAWSTVTTPSPPGQGDTRLVEVDARAADDVWAVGQSVHGARTEPVVEQWDGSAWTIVQDSFPS